MMAYSLRGDAKVKMQDYNGAIGDYTEAIKLGSDKSGINVYIIYRIREESGSF